MKISVIVVTRNEGAELRRTVENLRDTLPARSEIVIVDDGSTDGTTELLTQYQDSPLVVVHHSIVNLGKGAALRMGIAKSSGDILLVQDGDLEYDPRDYPKILEPLVLGRAKVVYG